MYVTKDDQPSVRLTGSVGECVLPQPSAQNVQERTCRKRGGEEGVMEDRAGTNTRQSLSLRMKVQPQEPLMLEGLAI